MTTMLETRALTGGVDTHSEIHVAAVIDHLGGVVGVESFPVDRSGYAVLTNWMTSFGEIGLVGVEGTGSYGAGLARHLARAGVVALGVEIDRLDAQIARLVDRLAPELVEVAGVGYYTAALLLVTAGDNPHRLRTEATWAKLCGVAPLAASSGKVVRYRLNRGGDRQANHALWIIVASRLSFHGPTKAYMARRLTEGKSRREVIRILKGYVAREVLP